MKAEVYKTEDVYYNGATGRFLMVLITCFNERDVVDSAIWIAWDTQERKPLFFNSFVDPIDNDIKLVDPSTGREYRMVYNIPKGTREAYVESSIPIYEAYINGELDLERMIIDYLI